LKEAKEVGVDRTDVGFGFESCVADVCGRNGPRREMMICAPLFAGMDMGGAVCVDNSGRDIEMN
jgi:hypothetical protein